MTAPTTTAPYRLPAGTGLADVWWKSGRISVKLTGAETGGALAQVESDDPRGAAPPLHVHRNEEETFYVLDGSLSVFVADEELRLETGDFTVVPRGVPHAYLVRSERARLLVSFSPAGFEEAFVELGVPVEGSAPPADDVFPGPEEAGRVFAAYGCEIVGPPPTL
ncbi:MAG TPA: quercetin 2,3-dioxygenase [Gaiellaceae bacterium]|jgi:quercetin dioxygenase-like cupin family protein|nr:quercetin 2,3-dioxygenase [Gaiellaceae bacterium]